MNNEDRIRFSMLLIVSVIVMTVNIQTAARADRRGLSQLDSMVNGYFTTTAQRWADASPANQPTPPGAWEESLPQAAGK